MPRRGLTRTTTFLDILPLAEAGGPVGACCNGAAHLVPEHVESSRREMQALNALRPGVDAEAIG